MCNVLCYDRVADVYKDGDCYIVVLHVIILLRMFHFEIIYIYICMYLFSTNPLFRNYYYYIIDEKKALIKASASS